MSLSQDIHISIEHVDFKKELKLSSLLTLFQEIASTHVEKLGYPAKLTLGKGLIWVIARQRIEIDNLPKYEDDITLTTYPRNMKHMFYPRDYEIKKGSETCINCSSIWGLMNIEDRKLSIPSNSGVIIDADGEAINLPLLRPIEGLENKARIIANYSNVDMNGHLNNTKYLDIVMDLIPIEYLKNHSPKIVDISYKKEIKLGEEIEIEYGMIENRYHFQCDNFIVSIEFK